MTTTTRSFRFRPGYLFLVIAAVLVRLAFGQQQVAIEKTGFENLPDQFFYFKDSEVCGAQR